MSSSIGASIANAVGSVTGTAQGISRLSSGLGELLSGNYEAVLAGLGPWAAGMEVASWRKVPFAVRRSVIRKGRRFADHVYPYRDTIWEEDLGRGIRQYRFEGFLVGDDVFAQSKKMQDAAEQKGTGTLVHPTLGKLTCALVEFEVEQDAEKGRMVQLRFVFRESASSVYPSQAVSTTGTVKAHSTGLLSTIASDFQKDVLSPLQKGAAVVLGAINTVEGWAGAAYSLVGDARMIAGSVKGLLGNFGIFNSGGSVLSQPATATASSLLAQATSNRTAVQTACTNAKTAAAALSSSSLASFSAAIAAVPASILAAANAPEDQVRLLTSLTVYQATVQTTGNASPIGQARQTAQTAIAALMRRSALAYLAQACAAYQPPSAEAAILLLTGVAASSLSHAAAASTTQANSITGLFDAEMINAADTGDLASYGNLRDLRAAVVQDMLTRVAQMPSQIKVTSHAPQPALQIANRLYQDATRSDDLIARAAPVHPAFMPTSFEALAS